MDAIWTLLPQTLLQHHWFDSLRYFMQQGGTVLWCLASVTALCWILIVERITFLWWQFPKQKGGYIQAWHQRTEHDSWYARSIRDSWLSQAHESLFQHLNIIKLLVAVCPMLGLLGTVTGMISVFDVMANQGSSDPKLMASGISLATLPTMAGMVAALTGMFAHSRLYKVCASHKVKLEKSLRSRR